MNKGKIITEYPIWYTKFSDWRKAQNLSFQLEKIKSLEMLCLGARSQTVAKLMTQAQLNNNENKVSKN